jgi:hypothetical protein
MEETTGPQLSIASITTFTTLEKTEYRLLSLNRQININWFVVKQSFLMKSCFFHKKLFFSISMRKKFVKNTYIIIILYRSNT